MFDLTYRPVRPEDYEFCRVLHHTTMYDYVKKIWGWDEALQDQFMAEKFSDLDKWCGEIVS